MDAKVVGQNIAKLRRKHKMTQKELADALFVVDKTISRWECGYGFPDVKLLPVIADMFHVSVDELIGNEQVDEENLKKSKNKKKIFKFIAKESAANCGSRWRRGFVICPDWL